MSCLASETSSLNPCGAAAGPVVTTTTSPTGAFSLASIKNGTYMLTIGKPIAYSVTGNYATLHRTIILGGGANSLGAVHLTSIPWPTPVWLATLNNARTQQSPVSFGNLSIDEYAQEQATAAAAAMSTGKSLIANYAPYGAAYAASAGAQYAAIGFSYEGNSSSDGPTDVNTVVFYAHKSACTPNWTNCSTNFEDYVQATSTRDVWVGLAQPPSNAAGPNYFYSFVIVTNGAGSMPL